MSRIYLGLSVFIAATGCVTTMEHGTKYANGVIYLAHSESYLATCKDLGVVMGRAASIWGGQVGNSQARIDLVDQAARAGATHVLEKDANWTDGGVTAQAFKCEKGE